MIKYIPEVCPDKYLKDCGGLRCPLNEAIRKDPTTPHYICAHPFDERRVSVIKAWNKLTEKHKQVDEYTLKGIEYWRVQNFELTPTYEAGENRKAAVKEGVTLLKEGFQLGYNTESGVGSLLPKKNGYVISSWFYQTNTISKEVLTAEEAAEWLVDRNARD